MTPADADEGLARLKVLASTSTDSSYRESLLEAIFVSELIQSCALAGLPKVELARAFVDFQG